jgi:hypothetical protein
MRRAISADLWSGLLFSVIGFAFIVVAREYSYGSAAQMGPGFFPTWLGALLGGLGTGLISKGLAAGSEPVAPLMARHAILVLTALLLFAALLERVGLIAAGAVLLVTASFATEGFRPAAFIVFMTGLLAFVAFLFVRLLGINIPLWSGSWF